jgi:hypothetical protein
MVYTMSSWGQGLEALFPNSSVLPSSVNSVNLTKLTDLGAVWDGFASLAINGNDEEAAQGSISLGRLHTQFRAAVLKATNPK